MQNLTWLKCGVVPCSLLSRLQIWACPGTTLPDDASTSKGAKSPPSKPPPISFPLTRLLFERRNAFFHFCVVAVKK